MHKMKLHNNPFQKIKNQTKTVEMRLNDEKRKNIRVGDLIEFKNITTNGVLYAEVINIYNYPSFEELYDRFDKVSIGYDEDDVANPLDMLMYYQKEDIEKYGVLGIEIRLLTLEEAHQINSRQRVDNTIKLFEELSDKHMSIEEAKKFKEYLK